uniref:Uncharacterized protein n=1 Tax=Avena sativa TaxID=4498 RepID=A0ACD5WEK2_AVESA
MHTYEGNPSFSWIRLDHLPAPPPSVREDPLTRHQRHVPFPPEFGNDEQNLVRHAAVVCTATDRGHVHGGCHSSPFKLVLLRNSDDRTEVFACLYDSNTGLWGHIISREVTDVVNPLRPGILVGDALYWLLLDDTVLEYDLKTDSLDMIEIPKNSHAIPRKSHFQVLRTKRNMLGLAILTGKIVELWERMDYHDGGLTWVLQNTIDLGKLLSLEGDSWGERLLIRGSDEDNNVIVVHTNECGVFMVELKSMWVKSVDDRGYIWCFYPYANFYMTADE